MTLHETLMEMGDRAVAAERQLATLGTRRKNLILEAMAEALEANRDRIKEANSRDMGVPLPRRRRRTCSSGACDGRPKMLAMVRSWTTSSASRRVEGSMPSSRISSVKPLRRDISGLTRGARLTMVPPRPAVLAITSASRSAS